LDLKAAAEMRVSQYFMLHDDQMVIVRRGDLRRIIKEFEAHEKR
jgi:hypothetical protein